ncbi:hypothetical protein FPV67DRAFT_1447145 [Lyophyllum atratum]|nr:hypothetical protein FPV67DRAFT_1447145 [Lyophyllum atratum]
MAPRKPPKNRNPVAPPTNDPAGEDIPPEEGPKKRSRANTRSSETVDQPKTKRGRKNQLYPEDAVEDPDGDAVDDPDTDFVENPQTVNQKKAVEARAPLPERVNRVQNPGLVDQKTGRRTSAQVIKEDKKRDALEQEIARLKAEKMELLAQMEINQQREEEEEKKMLVTNLAEARAALCGDSEVEPGERRKKPERGETRGAVEVLKVEMKNQQKAQSSVNLRSSEGPPTCSAGLTRMAAVPNNSSIVHRRHPSVPEDITVNAILNAKVETLRWWITRVNNTAKACGEKKNPLTKVGNAAALKEKLAAYYGLKLDVAIVPVTEKKKENTDLLAPAIRARQWGHLRELGKEWSACASRNENFQLCEQGASFINHDLQHDIQELLKEIRVIRGGSRSARPPADNSAETICAWVAAGREGDVEALSHLFQLQSSIGSTPLKADPVPLNEVSKRPEVYLASSSFLACDVPGQTLDSSPLFANPATVAFRAQAPALLNSREAAFSSVQVLDQTAPIPTPLSLSHIPTQQSRIPTLPSPFAVPRKVAVPVQNALQVATEILLSRSVIPDQPNRTCDGDILAACLARMKALEQANGLEEVISQVERGEVAKMREEFGPEARNKGGKPQWRTLKGTINKRERIYKQLITEFRGDKERFFTFFTFEQEPQKGKRKIDEGHRQLRSSNKVAEAIPHRDKDLKEEKESTEYWDASGRFSQHLWDTKWTGLNNWEIWRALAKEQY